MDEPQIMYKKESVEAKNKRDYTWIIAYFFLVSLLVIVLVATSSVERIDSANDVIAVWTIILAISSITGMPILLMTVILLKKTYAESIKNNQALLDTERAHLYFTLQSVAPKIDNSGKFTLHLELSNLGKTDCIISKIVSDYVVEIPTQNPWIGRFLFKEILHHGNTKKCTPYSTKYSLSETHFFIICVKYIIIGGLEKSSFLVIKITKDISNVAHAITVVEPYGWHKNT